MGVLLTEKQVLTEQHFSSIYETMKKEYDENNALKVVELYEKFYNNQYNICFAGHFSAGKSTLINYIVEKDVLPKSPIPTSANIVKVTSGEGAAKVFFKEEPPVQYNEPYNIDIIKDYCMNRDTIRQIEISTKEAVLPINCALIDTPGIDAADDADRLMTESAIHLIDELFYVMDYNHVQSEINLYFLQKMQQLGIPLYIIINQVDKHNEAELSFQDYTNKIKQTFDQWNIKPKNMFFSSIMDKSSQYNEIDEMKHAIFNMMNDHQSVEKQIYIALEAVIDKHKEFIKNRYEEQFVKATDDMNTDLTDLDKMNQLKQQLQQNSQTECQLKAAFQKEVQTTLKNAYIMPAKLRDLAEDFLISQDKDFKIGLFQSKKKTEEERQTRLLAFQSVLQQTMETTIQWKLREKLITILQEYNVADEELIKLVQGLTINVTEELLYAHMKKGAKVNGNYILNYTNDLSNTVKQHYRNAVNNIWEIISTHVNQMMHEEEQLIKRALIPFENHQEILEQNEEVNREIAARQADIMDQFKNPIQDENAIIHLQQALFEKNQVRIEQVPDVSFSKVQTKNIIATDPLNHSNPKTGDVQSITSVIESVVREVEQMKGFQSIVDDLKLKQHRLENRKLTIALFGTFSAGKSSFSNALFGKKVLPVSPNPTTAVISRISPVTEVHQHETVLISIKTEHELIKDLEAITKHVTDLSMNYDEWMDWIRKNRINEHEGLSKTYQAYLNAMISGYNANRNQLGETITISLADFPEYVTDETKACFIKHVDLFYDCSITRKGITLVDTPGADSVNARHTNVAFDYIKEADAILYVTYYNHAITSGDRDFLMQLGRVKEAFEMDKMFFIVNASDLAEGETDLQLVVDYVTQQLLQFGIRNPKIFPVSSKLSLEEKTNQQLLNKEMQQFEEVFYNFIEKDLISLTVEAAVWDMNRAKKALEEFISSLELNTSERQLKITALQKQKNEAIQLVNDADMSVFEERLADRIDRQLHFVLERLYIRFHDMFTEHFNPSTINTAGKIAQKQLENSRNQFIDYVGYELLQEVRAVALRIESYMRELLKNAYDMNQMEVKVVNPAFIFPSLGDIHLDTPALQQAFEAMDMSIFNKALKLFKNMKSFFEQNEREKMKDEFYTLLEPYADNYLSKVKKMMEQNYQQQWIQKSTHLKRRAEKEISMNVEEHVKVLTETVDLSRIKIKYKHISQLINSLDRMEKE